MPKERIIIKARIYEILSIGQFTIDTIHVNVNDFMTYKPNKYVAQFFTDLAAKQLAISNIVYPIVLTSELKLITLRLMDSVESLREPMNFLQGYVEDAIDLTVKIDDFGIKKVRKDISSYNVEELNGSLSVVITNITNNFDALSDIGYTDDMKTDLINLKKSIFDDNANQNKKLEERSTLVSQNKELFNDFLKDIKGIWADGQKLYRIADKEKAKLFTNAEILRRIRNDELHTMIEGTIKDKNDQPLSGVKIVARPTLEGKRGKTVTTDAKGHYELKGLKPTNYILTITFKNGKGANLNADAITNHKVILNYKEGE